MRWNSLERAILPISLMKNGPISEPFVRPEQSQYGPKIKIARREIVDAIRYLVRTGCQWRLIPHDFPNHSTVRH